MQTTFALAALAAVAWAAPQGVTTDITPKTAAPAGFSPDYDGPFEITIVKTTTTKRDSTCGTPGYLTMTLAGGQLTDAQGRTGYIAANYQFQFDKPAQTGAIYTGGFSVGQNGSLALGGSAVFYSCLSGSFYNLYDRSWAAQCSPILIQVLPCGTVAQQGDGQPHVTTIVTQLGDGQPQATTVVTQIPDGQVQAPTGVPVSEYTDGQPQVVTVAPKPMPTPVTQISDGQPQAPTSIAPKPTTSSAPAPVTQISDGQPQAPTTVAPKPPITSVPAPVTQISDGQPQAPTSVPPKSNTTISVTATPVPFTGGATSMGIYSTFAAALAGFTALLLL